MHTIISIHEQYGNLLVKIRDKDKFKIILYGNLTKKEFCDNQHLIEFETITRHIKYQPVAEFCCDQWGWNMGKLAMSVKGL